MISVSRHTSYNSIIFIPYCLTDYMINDLEKNITGVGKMP